jgi:hypothetical protein
MNERLSRYNVTVTIGCDGAYLPDPAAFAVAADHAAWSRSASIISAHLADKIISVVTVTAPDRYAAAAVARAVVSAALKRQALSSSRSADDRAITVQGFAQYRAPEVLVAGGARQVNVTDAPIPLSSEAGPSTASDRYPLFVSVPLRANR